MRAMKPDLVELSDAEELKDPGIGTHKASQIEVERNMEKPRVEVIKGNMCSLVMV